MGELPKHLKRLARNLDRGLDLEGKPLSNKKRASVAKLIGAKFMRTKEGKIKLVKD